METVKTLAAHTINLHLKDYVIVPNPCGVGVGIYGCPLGQGRTDYRAVLDAMPTLDMSAIFEHLLPRPDDMHIARRHEHSWLAQSVLYARNRSGSVARKLIPAHLTNTKASAIPHRWARRPSFSRGPTR